MIKNNHYSKRRLIKLALRGRARDEMDWVLTRWQRWFYTIKVILCILLSLRKSRAWNEYRAGDYPITVELFDCSGRVGSDEGVCHALFVGSYYFKNWWYSAERERM